MIFSVALIGLGNIGMRYDISLPKDSYIMSHARAFSMHPNFEIIGACDPNPANRQQFTLSYASPVFATSAELLTSMKADVIVIASPTDTHEQILTEIIQNVRSRVILCEKPLSYMRQSALRMVQLASTANIPLYINFIRRADPGVIDVRNRINSQRIKMPFKAIVWYSKGLLHNGSHFVDLMQFWFGKIEKIKLIQSGRSLINGDGEPDFFVRYKNGSGIFCAGNEEDYSHYTVELITKNGRLRYESKGVLRWQDAIAHKLIDGYKELDSDVEEIPSDMSRYQYHVVEQLYNSLLNREHTLCDAATAYDSSLWLEKIISLNKNMESDCFK